MLRENKRNIITITVYIQSYTFRKVLFDNAAKSIVQFHCSVLFNTSVNTIFGHLKATVQALSWKSY